MTNTATIAVPKAMQALPEARGYKVPFFVQWIDGQPEFRVMDPRKWRACVKHSLCWTCGNPLLRAYTFVIGPMCMINRISSEPPSHAECARYGALVCPFLTKPHMVRRDRSDLPEWQEAPGNMIERNPGVTLLWFARDYRIVHAPNGPLIQMGTPAGVEWYCQGRPASRAEVIASIEGGLPTLRSVAEQGGPDNAARTERDIERAWKWIPRN